MISVISVRSIKLYSAETYNQCFKIPAALFPDARELLDWIKSYSTDICEFRGKSMVKLHYQPIHKTTNIVIVPYFLRNDLALFCPQLLLPVLPVTKIYDHSFNFATEIWGSKQQLIGDLHTRLLRNRGATLQLDTGKGKTVILAKILHLLRPRNSVIFAGNKILADQMKNDIMEHLSLDNILMIGGDATPAEKKITDRLDWAEISTYPITIAIITSAVNIMKKAPDFWSNYGIAIYDECHKFCAARSRLLMFQVVTDYKLSLSATVTKYWNHPLIFHSSGEFMDGDSYITGKKMSGIVHLVKYYGPESHTKQLKNTGDIVCVSAMSSQFSHDEYRTGVIMRYIQEFITRGHNIFVFSNINEMVDIMHDTFEAEKPEGIIIGKINITTTKEQDEVTKRDANVIFINYMSGSDGLNIPRMTAMIFASSFRNNGIQISGRAMRACYDVSIVREFVDIVDCNASIKNQLTDRSKVWKKRQFEIREIVIKSPLAVRG
jgi:superfamily II DNA or RNA helicase